MENNYFKLLLKKIYSKIFIMRDIGNMNSALNNPKLKKRKIFRVIGGNLHPDKVFYIIQRHPGFGFFSNLIFVVNHIKIALDMGFIPMVDMQNFTNIYNEKEKIFNTFNSWEYYYEQISPYTLEEVYKSKNIILTDRIFYAGNDFSNDINEKKELVEILNKYIKVKKNKLRAIRYLKNKLFQNKKILGIHFRGTGYKFSQVRYPITINQMINKVNELLETENYEKIFIMTEDENNFKVLEKYYGKKLIFSNTSVRGKTNMEVYDKYPRSRHRYKIGRNVLIETYLLSYCDGFIDIETNPKIMVQALNLNTSQKRYTIDNGACAKWPVPPYMDYSWHMKNILSEKFGGFKNNKKPIKKLI